MRVGSCYNRYDDALGVKCVSWSPSGQLLSIGSYDEKLRILNHMTWKKLAEHDHTQTKVDGRSVDVYREHTFYDGETERTRYAVEDSTVVVPTETPDAKKPFPKLGVGMQAWSSDSALLFTRNDNAPTALWVWETVRRAFELVRLCVYACSSSVFRIGGMSDSLLGLAWARRGTGDAQLASRASAQRSHQERSVGPDRAAHCNYDRRI
jgi:hypothetical protein